MLPLLQKWGIGMKWFGIFGFALSLAICSRLQAQTATVTWTITHQTIDGFGAACYQEGGCNGMNSAQQAQVFSPTSGIGLSIFRVVVPDDGSCSSTCKFVDPQTEAAAASYGATLFATPWSPPASMKSNGSTICNTGSGDASLSTGSYAAYATYLKEFATQFASTYAKSLYAISVQNEPNFCPTTYDGAVWTSAEIDTFVKANLGPTLSGTGITVMQPESATWSSLASFADTCMTDSSCSSYVGLVAGHGYEGSYAPYGNQGSAHLWQTEVYIPQSGAYDPSMANALLVAQDIHNFLTVTNGNAYLYWRIYTGNSGTPPDNQGLIPGPSGSTPAQRFWAIGNWSKFVRPGCVRLGTTTNPQTGVYVTAFKNSEGTAYAIVAVNTNTTAGGISQTFSLSGFPTTTSVTPYVTSSTLNLAQQSSVVVSSSSLTYILPASSVTSLVGNTASDKGPEPPAELTVVVQ